MSILKVRTAKCLRPSSTANILVGKAFTAIGAVSKNETTLSEATISDGAYTDEAFKGGALLTAISQAPESRFIFKNLATLFQRSDDFCMEVDNERFWPQVEDMYMASADTAYINRTLPFENIIRINLKNHQNSEFKDSLAFLEINTSKLETDFIDSTFIIASPKEECIYELDIYVEK
ncbi:hypothetical protein [Agarilytica rhodophyticola]|uniref:hypothetical protein n=1 Tax=Agarilytica rhodophyticola TaxID=1737490 RepID=UPI000B345ACF|nr:hypothetical protein [Agarilytica rhodophyticola]